jgi:hypothetical protein
VEGITFVGGKIPSRRCARTCRARGLEPPPPKKKEKKTLFLLDFFISKMFFLIIFGFEVALRNQKRKRKPSARKNGRNGDR